MKRLLFPLLFTAICLSSNAQVTFTLSNPSGSDSITCTHPVVTFSATSNYSTTVNYSWNGPGFSATGSSVSITNPGSYTVSALSSNSVAATPQVFSVYGSTVLPNLSVILPLQTLTCFTPQVIVQGASTQPNVVFSWIVPGSTVAVLSNTLPVTILSASSNSTFIGNYTLSVTDKYTSCTSTTIIPFYQNIFPPIVHCNRSCIGSLGVTLVNTSTSGIPPSTGFAQMAITGAWFGPAPQASATASSYQANTLGTYTLVAQDSGNGCTSQLTIGICTGINSNGTPNNNISIFPNPTTGMFTIEGYDLIENAVVKIYNITGQLVTEQLFTPGSNTIDLSQQAPGLYMIHVLQNNSLIFTSKVLKQ